MPISPRYGKRVKQLISLSAICWAGVATALVPAAEDLPWARGAEVYGLKGVTGANFQSGARDESGNLIDNSSMNVGNFGTFKLGVQKNINEHFCLDLYHLNEGHVDNNHRDGFGVTGCARMKLGGENHVIVQLNAGPYFAMNTVNVNGVQYDRKEVGALVAAVIEKDLNQRGLKARLEIDKTIMFGSYNGNPGFSGTTVQLGLAQSLDDQPSAYSNADLPADWAVFIGRTKTNSTDGGFAGDVQIKRIQEFDNRYPGLTYSISALKEGDTGVTNRAGVAAQIGYEVTTIGGFKAGGEIGPYVSHDSTSGENRTNGLITLFVEKHLSGDYFVRAEFERAVSFSGPAKDADHFKIGFGKKW